MQGTGPWPDGWRRRGFSLFRLAGRHEAAGIWLEDLLDEDQRVWMVDEGLEASAFDGAVLGMRLFDAGPFHAGFGLVTAPDEETVQHCIATQAAGGTRFFRHSLAATLYSDELLAEMVPAADEDAVDALIETLEQHLAKGPTGRGRG